MAQTLTYQEASIDFAFDYDFKKGEPATRDCPGSADRVAITRVLMNGTEIPTAAINPDLYRRLVSRIQEDHDGTCSHCQARDHNREQLQPVVRPLFATPQIIPLRQAGGGQFSDRISRQGGQPESDREGPGGSPAVGSVVAEPKTRVDAGLAWKLAETMRQKGLLPLNEGFKKATYALQLLADMGSKPVEFAYLDKAECRRFAIGWFSVAPPVANASAVPSKPADPLRLARSYYDIEVGDWRSFRIDRLLIE